MRKVRTASRSPRCSTARWTSCTRRAGGPPLSVSIPAARRPVPGRRPPNKTMAEQKEELRPQQVSRESILEDYRVAFRSRQASLIGRKEVLTGKAKFGIFGDGKEVAQLAMARAFRKGDWRSGYYRDQTFLFATGMGTLDEFFGQLYADTDVA